MTKTVHVASSSRWATNDAYKGVWFYFATFERGQDYLVANLFENKKSRDYFINRQTTLPTELGRVRFK